MLAILCFLSAGKAFPDDGKDFAAQGVLANCPFSEAVYGESFPQ